MRSSPFLFACAALLFGSCAGSYGHPPIVGQARLPLAPGRTYYYVIREESRTFSDEKGVKVSRENGISLSLHCTASPEASGPGGGAISPGRATPSGSAAPPAAPLPGSAPPSDGATLPGGATPSDGATPPGLVHLRIRCDTLALHQHSDGDELNMDAASALESPDPVVRMLAAFDGAELEGRMDAQGKLQYLSGLQGVYLRMRDLGQEPGEDHSAQAIGWERQLDNAFFVSLLEKAWHIYPNAGSRGTGIAEAASRGLAIGDSWVLPDTLDADSHIPLETTYTLVRARDGILHFTTRAEVDIRDRNLDKTYRNGQITLKGKQVGFLDVDAATGMVLDGRSTLMAEGSLRMGETDIPLLIDSTYTVSALQS
jgi:hypothetical protein